MTETEEMRAAAIVWRLRAHIDNETEKRTYDPDIMAGSLIREAVVQMQAAGLKRPRIAQVLRDIADAVSHGRPLPSTI